MAKLIISFIFSWLVKQVRVIPSKFYSAINSGVINAVTLRPLSNCFGFSLDLYFNIFPSVIVLLRARSPSTILLTIPKIVVNAVYTVFFCWTVSHIKNKGLKLNPFFAVANPSASIKRVFRVVAPSFHCSPYIVFRRASAAMSCFLFPHHVAMVAPARLCKPFNKIASSDNRFIPAIANAAPFNVLNKVRLANNSKSVEFFPCKINCFSHKKPFKVNVDCIVS